MAETTLNIRTLADTKGLIETAKGVSDLKLALADATTQFKAGKISAQEYQQTIIQINGKLVQLGGTIKDVVSLQGQLVRANISAGNSLKETKTQTDNVALATRSLKEVQAEATAAMNRMGASTLTGSETVKRMNEATRDGSKTLKVMGTDLKQTQTHVGGLHEKYFALGTVIRSVTVIMAQFGMAAMVLKEIKDIALATANFELLKASLNEFLFAGITANQVLEDLRQKTHGEISDMELLHQAMDFRLIGVPLRDIGNYLEILHTRAKALVIPFDQAVEAFMRMELGNVARAAKTFKIKIDETKAEEDYAASVGKTISQLTKSEKQYSLRLQVIERLTEADKNLSKVEIDAISATEKLGAAWENLKTKATILLLPLASVAERLTNILDNITAITKFDLKRIFGTILTGPAGLTIYGESGSTEKPLTDEQKKAMAAEKAGNVPNENAAPKGSIKELTEEVNLYKDAWEKAGDASARALAKKQYEDAQVKLDALIGKTTAREKLVTETKLLTAELIGNELKRNLEIARINHETEEKGIKDAGATKEVLLALENKYQAERLVIIKKAEKEISTEELMSGIGTLSGEKKNISPELVIPEMKKWNLGGFDINKPAKMTMDIIFNPDVSSMTKAISSSVALMKAGLASVKSYGYDISQPIKVQEEEVEKLKIAWENAGNAIDKALAKKKFNDAKKVLNELKGEVTKETDVWEGVSRGMTNTINSVAGAVKNTLGNAFESMIGKTENYWARLFEQMMADLGEIAVKAGLISLVRGGTKEGEKPGFGSFFGILGTLLGFAEGGWIPEPVIGLGKSGRAYSFAEREPEYISNAKQLNRMGQQGRGAENQDLIKEVRSLNSFFRNNGSSIDDFYYVLKGSGNRRKQRII